MSKVLVDTIDTRSGTSTMQIGSTNTTTINLGVSGDTVNIPSGVTIANAGTATGFGMTGWSTGGTSNSLIPSATDQGIYLGVSSATASNLLDDYEEGTWSPVLENYGNTDYTITGARYTKIGRYVFVSCAIVTATPTDGSENFRLSGFPYTSLAYEGGNSNGGYIKAYKNVNTNFTFPIGSGSTIAVMYSETGTNVTYSDYGNVKKAYGSWVYEVG